ncbi:MAG TPA: lipase [Micromonosporaceae bacterium]|nr:lipase [Micromonosporaceae bacterium]
MRFLISLATAVAVSAGVLSSPAQAAPAQPEALVAAIEDWDCRVTVANPYPVVLVHGTGGNAQTWAPFVPELRRAGHCVFAPNYGESGFGLLGIYATAPVRESARQLADYVDKVLAETGAEKVSIIGHSQGGMMPRYYLRFLGGAAKVNELIGLAPSNHGTENPFAPIISRLCPACADQIAGSPFMLELNADRDVEPGVDYTVLSTRLDEVVTPQASQFLKGPANRVTNITIQDACPLNLAEHASILIDPVAWQWTLHALRRKGPASPSFAPVCL